MLHSGTKFLGGHGTAIGGFIVDAGRFDYGADPERFPGFNQPDPTYNGLVYARDLGEGGAFGVNLSYVLKARVQLLRDLGTSISPFNAFLIEQGIETLSLRVERHVANAQRVAKWLESRPRCARCPTRVCRPRRGTSGRGSTHRAGRVPSSASCWRAARRRGSRSWTR